MKRRAPDASATEDDAAAWAARLDGLERPDPVVDQALEAWLRADPRRAGALLRAQAALSLLDRGRALEDAVWSPPPANAIAAGRSPLLTRRVLVGAGSALAASAAGVGVLTWRAGRYATTLGEVRRVPLKDGSLMTINTASTVRVDLHTDIRSVAVDHGEAWFDVAKDAARPFVVQAGDMRVRAVGTAFSVRHDDAGARVMVTEGVVEAWRAGADQKERLEAGASAVFDDAHGLRSTEQPLPVIERALAWRDGRIELDGETLEAAAAEFNRYNSRKIVIDDPALAEERFVGLFQTNDPDGFTAAVAASLRAHVIESDGEIHLRRL